MSAERTKPVRGSLFVPGRIEVLGKHTDYAGGSSLTCAIELGFQARYESRQDGKLVLHDSASGEDYETQLPPLEQSPPENWRLYPWTVAQRVARDFPGPFGGATIRWSSDLPQAAGVSSSSALMVMLFLAMRETEALHECEVYKRAIETDTALAAYLAAVESGRAFASFDETGGVGTHGGAGDHTAILCSRAGRLHLYGYDPHCLKRSLAMPEGCVFVIGVSGIEACKTGSAAALYGRATELAARAAEVWREKTGGDEAHLGAMLAAASAAEIRPVLESASEGEFSGEQLVRRFDQFVVEESEVLPAAVEALAQGDLPGFGQAVDRSQRAAEDLLGNQIPETCFLQRSARDLNAHAASAFGAGFGGAVWAMVNASEAEAFARDWSNRYRTRYPLSAEAARFLITPAAPPARVMDLEQTH